MGQKVQVAFSALEALETARLDPPESGKPARLSGVRLCLSPRLESSICLGRALFPRAAGEMVRGQVASLVALLKRNHKQCIFMDLRR